MKKIILSFFISFLLISNSHGGQEFSPTIEDRLKQLETETHAKVRQLLRLAKKEIPDNLVVAETWRSMARQNRLYRKGSQMTKAKAGQSWHNWGRAVDIYFIKDNKILPYEKAPYKKLGELAESLGFIWGGRWKTPFDPGHFEYHPNLTIKDMLKNKEARAKWLK